MCRGLLGSFLAMRILVQMKIGKVLFYVHGIYKFEEIENDPNTTLVVSPYAHNNYGNKKIIKIGVKK